jgi:hypothetical protein
MEVVFRGEDCSLNVAITENGDSERAAFVADLLSPGGFERRSAEVVYAAADVTPDRVKRFIKDVRGLKVVEASLAS